MARGSSQSCQTLTIRTVKQTTPPASIARDRRTPRSGERHHRGRPDDGRRGVHVGPQHGRDDVDEDVADDAATDRGDRAEEDRRQRAQAVIEGLGRADHAEQSEAGGVQRVADRGREPVHRAVEQEHQSPAAEGDDRVGDRPEGGGRHVADQDVADHPPAEGGGEGDDHQAEHIESGVDAGVCATDGEHRRRREVEECQQAGPGGVPHRRHPHLVSPPGGHGLQFVERLPDELAASPAGRRRRPSARTRP